MTTDSNRSKLIVSSVGWEQNQQLSTFDCRLRYHPKLLDDVSYFLVVGASVSGSAMDDPAKVYAFFDDFSSATLKKEWVKNWGK